MSTVQIVIPAGEQSRKYIGDTVVYPRLGGLIIDKYNRTVTFADGSVLSIEFMPDYEKWPGGKLYPICTQVGEKIRDFYWMTEEDEKDFSAIKTEFFAELHPFNTEPWNEFNRKTAKYYQRREARDDGTDLIYEVANLVRCDPQYVPRDCSELKVGDVEECYGLILKKERISIGLSEITYRKADGTENKSTVDGIWRCKVKKAS